MVNIVREWNFENGISVVEMDYNYDLHSFDVYNGDIFLGTVYPSDIEEMKKCIECLDGGKDPISDFWEDGCGNSCSLEGWS